MLEIVILAAGKGTRMHSQKPKVMHLLAGKPLLDHVYHQAQALQPTAIHLVVGHAAEVLQNHTRDWGINCVLQAEQLGTGHAVLQALPAIKAESTVLILYGDVPLIAEESLRQLVAKVDDQSLALLTVELDNPHGYGRIARDESGQVRAIVEQKDASQAELQIREVNTGVMAATGACLQRWLPQLQNNNAQGEFYLTDIVALARAESLSINTLRAPSAEDVMGVNDRQQQAQLERIYQRRAAAQLMKAGVTLLDPERFDCRGTLTAGSDCQIDINCIFEGDVALGNKVTIGANCIIKNAVIGDHCDIQPNSLIEGSRVGNHCNVGPFARLRPGTYLADGAKIGNFVETKKAIVGAGSKINHLSYVGDAVLGANVNVGAGTITCNYDGVNKHLTEIGDDVFVGSNTALVAPVKLGHKATIGAGSTITRNVGDEQLAVARQNQRNIDGWSRPSKKPK